MPQSRSLWIKRKNSTKLFWIYFNFQKYHSKVNWRLQQLTKRSAKTGLLEIRYTLLEIFGVQLIKIPGIDTG